jgi:hypothetical protein
MVVSRGWTGNQQFKARRTVPGKKPGNTKGGGPKRLKVLLKVRLSIDFIERCFVQLMVLYKYKCRNVCNWENNNL